MSSAVEQVAPTPVRGLTEAEATARSAARAKSGRRPRSGRSYWGIVRANLFTFFNNVLYAIGVALVALEQYGDAFASVGLGLINALIGVVQEIRAKRKLDRIALLTRPTVTVVRDGRERPVGQDDVLPGDVVRIEAGDQITADGTVIGTGRVEVDESLLSGEPDLIDKQAGAAVVSGSVCVTGSACYEAEAVGEDSHAGQVTRGAREMRVKRTPLQRKIDLVLRLIMVVVALMSLAILLQAAIEDLPFTRVVQITAVLSGQVPYGLFFMAAIAYTLGAAAMARRGALAQQVNAIESLANVDVVCVDKTGTLTVNELSLERFEALDGDEPSARLRLGELARSTSVTNATVAALARALPGEGHVPAAEVAFTSARRWSAVSFADGPRRGVWALGGVDALVPFMADGRLGGDGVLQRRLAGWARDGLRVLVLAQAGEPTSLHDDGGEPRLPPLRPVAAVGLADELRPQARETIAGFVDLGTEVKIVSGDDPETVAAVARRAGLGGTPRIATGAELGRLTPAELDDAVRETTVFGRVAAEDKERIVAALARQGRYVAMIGDGVNDAPAVKRAHLGIAMQGGSSVTRDVADIVLLDDRFESLRPAFSEGRRIVAGLSNAMYLFLTRVATSTLLILAVAVVGLGFPYEPAQISLTLFTVGIPSFFLTLWARPDPPRPQLLRSLARFILPAAIVTAIFGVAIYTISYEAVFNGVNAADFPRDAITAYEEYTGIPAGEGAGFARAAATIEAQTMLSIFVSLGAFVLILFLEPPARIFTAWTGRSPDRRPALLVVALLAVFLVVISTTTLAARFGLIVLGGLQAGILVAALVLWFLVLSVTWRAQVFDRLFSLDRRDP